MPQEVREYIVRCSIKAAHGSTTSNEDKRRLCQLFLQSAMSGVFSDEMTDELVAAAYELASNTSSQPVFPG